jgi:hypothetical protein
METNQRSRPDAFESFVHSVQQIRRGAQDSDMWAQMTQEQFDQVAREWETINREMGRQLAEWGLPSEDGQEPA